MRLMITLARAYPWQTLVMVVSLLLAGLAEGVSLTALLPLLDLGMDQQSNGELTASNNGVGAFVTSALQTFGIVPSIGSLLIVIVLGMVLKSGLLLIANKHVGYTVAQVATDLRLKLLRALLCTRWEYYLRQPVGRLANAMSSEAARGSTAYLDGVAMIAILIQVLAYTSVALLVSWKATLAYLTVGAVLLYFLHHLVHISRRAGKRQTKVLQALLGRLTDCLQSVKPLKAMGRDELADAVIATETKRLNRALQRDVFSKEALKAVQSVLFAALVALALYIALVQWGMSGGTVIVLVLLLARVLSNLGKVQRQYQKMVVNESAFWSLQATINSAEHERESYLGTATPSLEKAIRLDRVNFAYENKPILEDASLNLPAGSLTALVGPSGAGKTTIIDLITGLLRPNQGHVLIDGKPLTEIDLRRWRRMIGYVPQETVLLHDSVLNNVTLGDPELTQQDAEWALRAAGAWDFVSSRPEGLQTSVGERGTELSGGQRQRIMIARALVHRPKLLILDEATSALDPDSEAAVCNSLAALRGELTVLAISHQPAIVDTADRVYRLQEGTLWYEDRNTTAYVAELELPSGMGAR